MCLPGEGTIHFSTNCPKIINIGESTPLEVVWIGCELTTSNFQPKRSSFAGLPPEQENEQGMRMLTPVSDSDTRFLEGPSCIRATTLVLVRRS